MNSVMRDNRRLPATLKMAPAAPVSLGCSCGFSCEAASGRAEGSQESCRRRSCNASHAPTEVHANIQCERRVDNGLQDKRVGRIDDKVNRSAMSISDGTWVAR